LYNEQKNSKIKINLLTQQIQEIFASIFRQTAFYFFENDIHRHRRQKGELSTADFNNYYQDRLQSMFGSGLKLTDSYQYFWMHILHFYYYHFYTFTYSFGKALTIALYANTKKTKKNLLKIISKRSVLADRKVLMKLQN